MPHSSSNAANRLHSSSPLLMRGTASREGETPSTAASRQVEENWNNSEYILDADSFVGVDFSARTNERSREYER